MPYPYIPDPSYAQYGTINASTYNAFADMVNSIYKDNNPGATTLPNASYGYGQTTPSLLTNVPVNTPILASQWADLFTVIKNCGNHQGTTVVPPLPGVTPGYGAGSTSLPVVGSPVIAYDTPSSALTTLINTLIANRFNLYAGQTSTITGTHYSSTGASWLTTLTCTYQVDFGSWNNARYFFNSGGSLSINGAWPTASTVGEVNFKTVLTNMSPLKFTWDSTTPASGSGGTAIGFYGLTTTYPTNGIYKKLIGAGNYTNSYVQVDAKLAAAAGTNGLVDFRIRLIDNDPTPNAKTGVISFWTDHAKSTAPITYPGTVTIGTNSFTQS